MKNTVSTDNKPYNKCLSCHHRGTRCDGPRTSAMTLARWCEFMKDMKKANNLSNIDVAERSGVSLKTVERLMALNSSQDIMRETARLIEDAIIGSSNQYPCYLAFEENGDNSQRLSEATRELERALSHNEENRKVLDEIHSSYNAEMKLIREEAERKTTFLLELTEFYQAQLKKKDEQLEHRKFAMQEKQQVIEWQREDIVELKAEISRLRAQLAAVSELNTNANGQEKT